MKSTFTIFLSSLLLLGIGISTSQCTNEAEIKKDNVARIIKTLSSDKMKGRSAFSPEATLAADFISNEFRSIGLETFSNEIGYLQNFFIQSITQKNASVTINDKKIDNQKFFTRAYSENINWSTSEVDVFHISKGDDFRAKQREYSNDDISSLVLIDKSHKEWFHRYRRHFSRPTRTFKKNISSNDVFVIYNGSLNSFEVTIENDIKPIDLFNVVGKIEGQRSDEIVIFSAHYDHIGVVSPVEGDSIANGANDNASGVAAVIELARHFSKQPKPKRTLLFVGFTAEEAGGFGSRYFSEQLDPENIVAMFNIEMIGKPALDKTNSAWITGFELSTFGKILQNSMPDTSFIFYPDPYPNQNLFYRSDNATLARLGVAAHSISTTPIDVDEDYHRVSDEFKTIDVSHATNTISAIAKAAESIISGRETPTRISLDTIQ